MRWYLNFCACLLLANLCIAASSLAHEGSAPGDRPPWEQAPESDEAKESEGLEAQIEKQDREGKLSEEAVEREKESPDFEVIDSDVQPMNIELIEPEEPALPVREPDERDDDDAEPQDQDPDDSDLVGWERRNREHRDRDLRDNELQDPNLSDRDSGEGPTAPARPPAPRVH
jgi:hypothetical protein